MFVDYSDSDTEPDFQKKRVEGGSVSAIAINIKP